MVLKGLAVTVTRYAGSFVREAVVHVSAAEEIATTISTDVLEDRLLPEVHPNEEVSRP